MHRCGWLVGLCHSFLIAVSHMPGSMLIGNSIIFQVLESTWTSSVCVCTHARTQMPVSVPILSITPYLHLSISDVTSVFALMLEAEDVLRTFYISMCQLLRESYFRVKSSGWKLSGGSLYLFFPVEQHGSDSYYEPSAWQAKRTIWSAFN